MRRIKLTSVLLERRWAFTAKAVPFSGCKSLKPDGRKWPGPYRPGEISDSDQIESSTHLPNGEGRASCFDTCPGAVHLRHRTCYIVFSRFLHFWSEDHIGRCAFCRSSVAFCSRTVAVWLGTVLEGDTSREECEVCGRRALSLLLIFVHGTRTVFPLSHSRIVHLSVPYSITHSI